MTTTMPHKVIMEIWFVSKDTEELWVTYYDSKLFTYQKSQYNNEAKVRGGRIKYNYKKVQEFDSKMNEKAH